MLFPVRQMIIVISGNEMAREPILCWEGRQHLALYKKQVWWPRTERWSRGASWTFTASISLSLSLVPSLIVQTETFSKGHPSAWKQLWRKQRLTMFLSPSLSFLRQSITIGRSCWQSHFLTLVNSGLISWHRWIIMELFRWKLLKWFWIRAL